MRSPYDDTPAAALPTIPAMNNTSTNRDYGHLVVFNDAPYSLCAPAAEVEGIIVAQRIRPLPQAPPSIIGVVQHRGQVYQVVSLRRRTTPLLPHPTGGG